MPVAALAWASFPCTDLSLAGNMEGLATGSRSGLYWQWIRVLSEMPPKRRPSVVCVENVVGFLVAKGGSYFREAYQAIRKLGYRAGAMVIDAAEFVPQSRPRSFIIAVREDLCIHPSLVLSAPKEPFHTPAVLKAWRAAQDPAWIWWNLPSPPKREKSLTDIVELDKPVHSPAQTRRLLSMLAPIHQKKLREALSSGKLLVGAGYKRTRKEAGKRHQRLEIRFDGMAGCLRTPKGGSSRQLIIIVQNGEVRTRLLTVREAARLMGARESFKIPGSYNDGYQAMGDAVVVGVTRWLARHLLHELAQDGPKKLTNLLGNASA